MKRRAAEGVGPYGDDGAAGDREGRPYGDNGAAGERAAEGVGPYEGAGACPYDVGDKVRFQPCACWGATAGFAGELGAEVTGVVIEVNEARRWYRVEYEMPGCIGHEVFKF